MYILKHPVSGIPEVPKLLFSIIKPYPRPHNYFWGAKHDTVYQLLLRVDTFASPKRHLPLSPTLINKNSHFLTITGSTKIYAHFLKKAFNSQMTTVILNCAHNTGNAIDFYKISPETQNVCKIMFCY